MMKRIIVILTLLFYTSAIFAQTNGENPFLGDAFSDEPESFSVVPRIDVESIRAMEQFTWGLRAFHEGLYNKALLNFENAVRLKPNEALYQLWLGYANFATGLDDLAIRQWQGIINHNQIGGGWLKSRIETLLYRTSPYQDNVDQDVWTVRHEIEGRSDRTLRFDGPTDLASDPLGTLTYVAGYLSNNIAVFDVNGNLRTRFSGGIMELDGPWGVLAMNDGNIFVSEFRGRRITLLNSNGKRLLTFGNAMDEGNLLGPQYMASTENGYLYVSDWAGAKVVKYDFNGKYIMSIGAPTQGFSGLKQPSGVATTANELFVVDTKDRVIHVFDHYGNYLRSLGQGELEQPEQITIIDNRLLIADGRRVLNYNLHTNALIEATNLNSKAQRIVSIDKDRNGTIVVADQARNNVTFLIPRSELYGSFFLNVHQVISDDFPNTRVLVSVQNRSGQPILGLNSNNFFIEENGYPLESIIVETLDTRKDGSLASVILVENSPEMQTNSQYVLQAIQGLSENMNSEDLFSLVWASEQPVHSKSHNSQEASNHFYRLFTNLVHANWRFDRGVRLAGSQLINQNARLAIFFITTGNNDMYYNQYSPLDLASYLKNNNIAFYPIYLKPNQANRIYDNIARETGGQSFYLFRPRGLNEIVEIARNRATGLYQIRYASPSAYNYGKDYIYLSLMASIQSQSGLTQSGYFPPLTLANQR